MKSNFKLLNRNISRIFRDWLNPFDIYVKNELRDPVDSVKLSLNYLNC